MSGNDWRLSLKVGFLAPFLNPLSIFGMAFALFIAFSGLSSGVLGITAISILIALAIILGLGVPPALVTSYRLIRRFRAELEEDMPPSTGSRMLRGMITGLVTSFLYSAIVVGLIYNEDGLGGILIYTAAISVGGGTFSGMAAAWLIWRKLRTEGAVRVSAFD